MPAFDFRKLIEAAIQTTAPSNNPDAVRAAKARLEAELSAAHQRITEGDANKYAEIVPANAFVLHPCLTRELIAARAHVDPNDPRFFSMMTFDNLGCRVDPVSGFRIPEDCGQNPRIDPEVRALCPGIEFEHTSIEDKIRGLQFAKQVLPFILKLVPIVGSAVAAAVAPLINEVIKQLGEAGGVKLDAETKRILQVLSDAVQAAFHAAQSVEHAARSTFHTLGVSTKTLIDAFPSNAFGLDPKNASLIAYSGAREALSFGANLLRGHGPTLSMLQTLAIDAPLHVVDFASAKIAQDGKKMLVSTIAAGDFVKDARGSLSADIFDNLIYAEMPSVTDLGDRALAGLPLAMSADMTQRFAGKADAALASFSVEKIMQFVPSIPGRNALEAEIRTALSYDKALEPFVKQAEQSFGRELDAIKRFASMSRPSIRDIASTRDFERAMRHKLETAHQNADLIVQSAIVRFAPYEIGV